MQDDLKVIGFQWSPEAHEIKDFLARARIGYRWLDMETNDRAIHELDATGCSVHDLPIVVFSDGKALANPSPTELAERIGLSTQPEQTFYDLVIVGAGPAGLAAGVYAASEGLRTVLIERDSPGGQASMSARIDNYLGFPDGISGGDLARRAIDQVAGFGAEVIAAREAVGIRRDGRYNLVRLEDDREIAGHTILLSLGVQWRMLDAPGCDRLSGSGIYYGSAEAEAAGCREREVYLLGGGNSAGQAAMHLARYASHVHLCMLEESPREKMSEYLAERIERVPNLTIHARTTIDGAEGEAKLEKLTLKNIDDGESRHVDANLLFVFIGAQPTTDWLDGTIARDEKGYIQVGRALRRGQEKGEWCEDRMPRRLETSIPGVFAAGDVRTGSAKRIAAAVGDGALAVQLVHEHLRER